MAGKFLKIKGTLGLFGLVLVLSCKHEVPVKPTPPNNGDPTQPCDPNKVYFQRDVLPILLSNCTMSGCHNATDREDGVVLDTYNGVIETADVRAGDADDSDLYEVLVENDPDKRMPFGGAPLPQAQRDIIKNWINQGAKNEICGQATCDSTNVTYSATIQPLIQNNCSGCHNNSLASGGYNFATHAGLAVAAQNGKLVGAVAHAPGFKPMPQGGKLTDCQVAQIKNWVAQGYLNN